MQLTLLQNPVCLMPHDSSRLAVAQQQQSKGNVQLQAHVASCDGLILPAQLKVTLTMTFPLLKKSAILLNTFEASWIQRAFKSCPLALP